MLGTCFSLVLNQLRAWASSLERKATCLVTWTWEEIPKMELDPLMRGGTFRRKGAHPYASTQTHTPPHSSSHSSHSTPPHITPLHSTSPHSISPLLYAPLPHHLCISSCTSTFSLGNCHPKCNKQKATPLLLASWSLGDLAIHCVISLLYWNKNTLEVIYWCLVLMCGWMLDII